MSFRILIVDDNRSLVEALSDIFEAKGYEPEVAFDGLQAIEKVKAGSFDCILMDIRMPKMSGVSAFKEIKKLCPGIPVILMTAYSVQGLIDEARSEGVLAVIQKPVTVEKVLGILDELRDHSSALIVDPVVDPLLSAALTERGYRSATAKSVSEAITMICRRTYDAVLLNMEIPGVTPDSLVLIKECDPKCLIILMSTQPEATHDPAICATLQKPFKMKDVVALLDRVRSIKVQDKMGKDLFEL